MHVNILTTDGSNQIEQVGLAVLSQRGRAMLHVSVASTVQYVERKFRFRFTAAYK